MLRPRYVRGLLLELSGVRTRSDVEDSDSEGRERQRGQLERSARRALGVAVLDGVALVVLLGWRLYSDQAVLPLGRTEESVFTVAVVVIAVHLGFRLAQRQWLASVLRSWDDLPD